MNLGIIKKYRSLFLKNIIYKYAQHLQATCALKGTALLKRLQQRLLLQGLKEKVIEILK